ncbi:Histone demethylase UTY [Plecturocebus cupreus]
MPVPRGELPSFIRSPLVPIASLLNPSRQSLAMSSRLECSGNHSSLQSQTPGQSSNPSTSLVAWDYRQIHGGSPFVAQAGLELLTSSNLPTSASQSAGVTGLTCQFLVSLDFSFRKSRAVWVILLTAPKLYGLRVFPLSSEVLLICCAATCAFQHSNCPCTFPGEQPTCSLPDVPLNRRDYRHLPPCPANFQIFRRDGFHHFSQASLKLLTSPHAWASQSAGITVKDLM